MQRDAKGAKKNRPLCTFFKAFEEGETDMVKLIKGYASSLEMLIHIDGYTGFLIKSGESGKSKSERRVDLGYRRVFGTLYENLHLVLVGNKKIFFYELPAGRIKLQDFLKEKGYTSKLATDYKSNPGLRTNWERAMKERPAVFSENGYALQYCGYLDYTFYQFELNIINPGWVKVGGHDIEKFETWNVMEDILRIFEEPICNALTGRQDITGQQLSDLFKAAKIEDEIEWLRMYERD